MIYVAHTDSTARISRNGGPHDTRMPGPDAPRMPRLDRQPLAQAGSRNRSLAFGPAIVRKSRSDLHLCPYGETAVRHVNRLWYGRALVALRTYPQWMLRAQALARHAGLLEDGNAACTVAPGNPVQ